MALKLNFSKNYEYICRDNGDVIRQNTNYPNGYVQIVSMEGNKNQVKFSVSYFADNDKTKVILGKSFVFTPSVTDGSKNFIAQGYDYLKTLNEFKDAEDC